MSVSLLPLRDKSLIGADAEAIRRMCDEKWRVAKRAHVLLGAGYADQVAQDVLALLEALELARTGLANVTVSSGVPSYVIRNCEHYLAETGE